MREGGSPEGEGDLPCSLGIYFAICGGTEGRGELRGKVEGSRASGMMNNEIDILLDECCSTD